MGLQPRNPYVVVGGFLCVEERLERRLGVDDNLLATWQMDDQVWPEAAVVTDERALLVEIAALHHAGNLHDAAELHFTPATPDGWRSQRPGQGVRGGIERRHLLGEPCVGRHAVAFGLGQPRIHPLQCVRDRLLKSGERCLGQIEEGRSIVLERLGRERLERVAQAPVRGVEQRVGIRERLLLTRHFLG